MAKSAQKKKTREGRLRCGIWRLSPLLYLNSLNASTIWRACVAWRRAVLSVGRGFTALVRLGLFARPAKTAMLRRLQGSLSKGVFERRTSTVSKAFSFLICLDDIKFVLHSFFNLIETIWLKIRTIPSFENEKKPLPIDVCRSKTSLLERLEPAKPVQ